MRILPLMSFFSVNAPDERRTEGAFLELFRVISRHGARGNVVTGRVTPPLREHDALEPGVDHDLH